MTCAPRRHNVPSAAGSIRTGTRRCETHCRHDPLRSVAAAVRSVGGLVDPRVPRRRHPGSEPSPKPGRKMDLRKLATPDLAERTEVQSHPVGAGSRMARESPATELAP